MVHYMRLDAHIFIQKHGTKTNWRATECRLGWLETQTEFPDVLWGHTSLLKLAFLMRKFLVLLWILCILDSSWSSHIVRTCCHLKYWTFTSRLVPVWIVSQWQLVSTTVCTATVHSAPLIWHLPHNSNHKLRMGIAWLIYVCMHDMDNPSVVPFLVNCASEMGN